MVTLAVTVLALLIALLALRLAFEQARSYLFPVPRLIADGGKGGLLLQNLGGGAMVDVRIVVELAQLAGDEIRIERHLPSLIAGESALLMATGDLRGYALAEIRGDVMYRNIRNRGRRRRLVLGASELDRVGE